MHNTLVMHGPDFREGEKIKETTTITDVAPTIVKILGIHMETQGEPLNKVLK